MGWSDVNFTEYAKSEDLREAVRKKYYASGEKCSSQTISRHLNEVERFKGIRKGDYIIVPYYSNIALAIAEDGEIFSPADYDRNLSNQRKVSYRWSDSEILKIPRNELSEGLQRRLRVRGRTVSNLFEFADEINRIFSPAYSYSHEMKRKEQEDRDIFKRFAQQYSQRKDKPSNRWHRP